MSYEHFFIFIIIHHKVTFFICAFLTATEISVPLCDTIRIHPSRLIWPDSGPGLGEYIHRNSFTGLINSGIKESGYRLESPRSTASGSIITAAGTGNRGYNYRIYCICPSVIIIISYRESYTDQWRNVTNVTVCIIFPSCSGTLIAWLSDYSPVAKNSSYLITFMHTGSSGCCVSPLNLSECIRSNK